MVDGHRSFARSGPEPRARQGLAASPGRGAYSWCLWVAAVQKLGRERRTYGAGGSQMFCDRCGSMIVSRPGAIAVREAGRERRMYAARGSQPSAKLGGNGVRVAPLGTDDRNHRGINGSLAPAGPNMCARVLVHHSRMSSDVVAVGWATASSADPPAEPTSRAPHLDDSATTKPRWQ